MWCSLRRDRCSGKRRRVPEPEVRLHLRAVVEAEHALDHVFQFCGYLYISNAPAVAATRVFVIGQVDSKRFADRGHGSGQRHAPFGGISFHDCEVMLVGEFLDLLYIVRIGAMSSIEFFAAHVFTRLQRSGSQFFYGRQTGGGTERGKGCD